MGVFSKYSNNYDNGKKLMEEGEFNQAIYEFDKCIDSHGHDSYILQLKAYCLMQLEEYNQAIECYEIILDDYNYDLDRMVLNNIGIAYNNIDKPEVAIEYFDEGIKYYPDYLDFWINKAWSLITLEKYEEALECYEEVLNLDFSNKAANEGYNYLCEKLGIEGKDFFDPNKLFNNTFHDSIAGLNASSYLENKFSISETKDDEISEDGFENCHGDFEQTSNERVIFCQNCGLKLNKSDDFCYKCGTKLNKIIFCTECGTKLRSSYAFCKNCGAKLE